MDALEREAFSPDEFAKRHGIGRTTVIAEIKNGRLIAKKIGKRTLISTDDGKAWLASLPRAGEFAAA